MTPKEKANEIANNMYNGSVFSKTKQEHLEELENAKRCALVAVNEIIATCPQKENEIFAVSKGMKYWADVKKEVEILTD